MHEENETIVKTDSEEADELALLRSELARRDAEESERRAWENARNALSKRYDGFLSSYEEVKELAEQTPILSSLTPEEKLNTAYLMLLGRRLLEEKTDNVISDDRILAELDKRPNLISRYAENCRGKKEPPVRFALGERNGIYASREKTPENLHEARSAAMRYVKRG